MSQPYPPHFPPGAPPPAPQPHSSMAIGAFAVALIGFLAGLIPFAGFFGTIGLILAVVELRDLHRPDRPPRKRGFAVAAVVLGSLATVGAVFWVIVFVWIWQSPGRASCPRVYSFDGKEYRIDADLVSGAIYSGVERSDHDRLESLQPVDGEYRLKVQNDLEEIDHLNSLGLLVVDHAAGTEILPDQRGGLFAVKDAEPPVRAVDADGRDVLSLLADLDSQVVSASDRQRAQSTRETWVLEFPRPRGNRALLVVRGRNSAFAEEAFVRYLAEMGRGVGPLMQWALSEDCPCNREFVSEEIERLGLPLWVGVSTGTEWSSAPNLEPVGPAVLRSQVLPIDLPPGGDLVRVRLQATPRFWELDQIQLAPAPAGAVEPQRLRPRSATLGSAAAGNDVTVALSDRDDLRVVLHTGERVDVRFEAPPAIAGQDRTVVVALAGYYQLDVGGRPGLDLAAVIAHRTGLTTLPEFAASLAR